MEAGCQCENAEGNVDGTYEEDCQPDPRVKEELDILNQASMDVNRLENELNEARNKYRWTFTEASQRMEELGSKIRKSIQRARQYYELAEKAKEAQSEAVRSARQYQTANGVYKAAKETIALAELRLIDEDTQSASLSSAWQEMLNHATVRVMEAEREKTRSETEHHKRAAVYAEIEAQLHMLEKKFKRSIAKARPYFETKAELELKLQQLKQNVWDLQQAISINKTRYANALHNLESISEEIHASRRSKLLLMFPREPGVGAESDSLTSSISDVNIEKGVFPTSSSIADSLSTTGGDDEESGAEGDDDDVFSCHGGERTPLHSKTSSGADSAFQGDTRLIESSLSESVTSPEGLSLSPCSNRTDISLPEAATSSQDCLTSATKGGYSAALPVQNGSEDDSRSEASRVRVAGDGSPTTEVCDEVSSTDTLRAATESLGAQDSDGDSGLASAVSDSEFKAKGVESANHNYSNSNKDHQDNGRVDPKIDVLDPHNEHVVPSSVQGKTKHPTKPKHSGKSPNATETQVNKLPLRRTDCGRNHRPLQGFMLLNASELGSGVYKF